MGAGKVNKMYNKSYGEKCCVKNKAGEDVGEIFKIIKADQ